MRRFDFLEIVLVVLTILVIFAIITVLLAISFPQSTKAFVFNIQEQLGDGKGPLSGFFKGVGRQLNDAMQYRFKPALEWVANLFRNRKKLAREEAEPPALAAANCIRGGCHSDAIFKNRKVDHIYVDHLLHDAQDVPCSKCHQDTEHRPASKRVAEATCLGCHKSDGVETDCRDCHAEGSILNAGVIPKHKTDEFLAGSTVSSKLLTSSAFQHPAGEQDQVCRQCHDVPEFCNRCHLVFHNRIPDWRKIHGPRILRQEYVMAACWTCHNSSWCAVTCHTTPSATSRPTGPVYKSVPNIPLETYER